MRRGMPTGADVTKRSATKNMLDTEIRVTPELAAEHGLTADEYARIQKILGRDPNFTELDSLRFGPISSRASGAKAPPVESNAMSRLKPRPTNLTSDAGEQPAAGLVGAGFSSPESPALSGALTPDGIDDETINRNRRI